MAEKVELSTTMSSQKCPVCGCDKPKTLVDGKYRCDTCTCDTVGSCRWHGYYESRKPAWWT